MSHPLIMGIVNVTPDSFSGDGALGRDDDNAAVAQALQMVADGADIIDIGGESTRPGHAPVTVDDEIRRVVPVITALRATSAVPISIDTTKAAVAAAALEAGADIVNDVLALRGDPAMAAVVTRYNVLVILMHNRSALEQVTQTAALGASYAAPNYTDFLAEIQQDLRASVAVAVAAGIQPAQIILDPGLGFGKTAAQNMQLIKHCDTLVALGYPILLGSSRKSFIGRVLDLPVTERDEATLAACVIGWQRGAKIFRVHDVRATRRALAMAQAILTA
jgi:dihydropteroate synthase